MDLSSWDRRRPLHLNVCLEEPKPQKQEHELKPGPAKEVTPFEDQVLLEKSSRALDLFIKQSRYPFVTVGTLKPEAREAVAQFLLKLGAPVYLEAISGLREDPRLQPLALHVIEKFWQSSQAAEYSVDSILRIGGVPTPRFWRDLEEREGSMRVLSVNEDPFSGLSWGAILAVPLQRFFQSYQPPFSFAKELFAKWKALDFALMKQLERLYEEEPTAEASLIHALSRLIPSEANLYLGNSLPIRHWNMAACRRLPHCHVSASRGLIGIDGQLSTFLGLALPGCENWALLGDLTALHDLGGWWVLSQMRGIEVKVVVVNNGGGKIFATRGFNDSEMQNQHQLHFEAVAQLWGVSYQQWRTVPQQRLGSGNLFIELIPDEAATQRFGGELQALPLSLS